MRVALLAGALAQVLVLLVVGWVLADAVLTRLGPRAQRSQSLPEGIELPERALLAIVGGVAFSVGLMIANALGRGVVFGNAFVVPAAGLAVVVWGVVRGRWPWGVPWLLVTSFGVILLAIYEMPLLLEGTGVRAGDSTLHMGWTEQLLGGESVPPGPAPELARNAYPWGFHAVMATMVRLVPATDKFAAQEGLHLLLLIGIPLGFACFARLLRTGSGWAGALCGALIGGFGWIVARGADFVASPSKARYGADMVAASPNSAYELFPPAFPRELGLVVLAAAGLLIARAVSSDDRRLAVLGGASAGLVGLISVPLFLSSLLWTVAGAACAGARRRASTWVALAGPAFAVFLLWAGPVAYNYVRYGGFVQVSPRLGVEWPFVIALAAWGLLLPLAIVGIAGALRSATRSARVVLWFAAAGVIMLILARARAAFGWNLAGNATALHQGRVWPVVHLLGAGFAGAALGAGFGWLRARSELLAPLAVGAVAVLGSPSLWLSSQAFVEILDGHEAGFVYGRADFAPGGFVMNAAAALGPGDVVRAPENESENALGIWLFQFSGARVSGHQDSRFPNNELRIRYADLAEEYGRIAASRGFDVDFVPMPATEAAAEEVPQGAIVAEGELGGIAWVLVEAGALTGN